MFYFGIILSLSFHIKNPDGKYIGGKDISTPRLADISEADLYEFEDLNDDGWKFIIAKNKDDKIFDIAGDYKDLIYYSHRHAGPNQRFRFKIVGGNTVMIENPKGCLEYLPKKNSFERKPCMATNEFQLFIPVSPQELLAEIKGGVDNGLLGPQNNPIANALTPPAVNPLASPLEKIMAAADAINPVNNALPPQPTGIQNLANLIKNLENTNPNLSSCMDKNTCNINITINSEPNSVDVTKNQDNNGNNAIMVPSETVSGNGNAESFNISDFLKKLKFK